MNLFKRISATITSRVDEAVRGIENHDAVVGVSLGDLRRAIAEARVRGQRMRADIEQQDRRRAALVEDAERWRGRAVASDEATALECLRRARACDQQTEALDRGLAQQRAASERMARALARLEQRHRELASQREALRGREAAARADRTAESVSALDDEALQQTLERWDIDITRDELAATVEVGYDELAQQFDAAEEDADLRAELSVLRNRAREE